VAEDETGGSATASEASDKSDKSDKSDTSDASDGSDKSDKSDTSDTSWRPVGAVPQEPGWYPMRTNPNDQAYWDGEGWTARRRWMAGRGWVESGDVPVAVATGTGVAAESPRLSANPYVKPTPAESRVPGAVLRRAPSVSSPLSVGLLLFMASGVLLMAGSVTTWIHASSVLGPNSTVGVSTPGLAVSSLIGIDGYTTFICGVVVTVLAGALMASDDSSLRLLAFVASLVAAGFAIYALVRVVQKIGEISTPHVTATVGPGLFIVAIGGVLAPLVAGARLGQRTH